MADEGQESASASRIAVVFCKIPCTNTCTSDTIHTFIAVNSSSKQSKRRSHTAGAVLNRIADRVDLAIDVMTLGQYGLEQVPAADAECQRKARPRRARRRGVCEPMAGAAPTSWDWPSRCGDAVAR